MLLAITGTTGFLGRAVVRRALGAGHEVRAIVPLGRKKPEFMHGVQIVEVRDLNDWPWLARAFKGVDGVFHLAGLAHKADNDPAADRKVHELINTRFATSIGQALVSDRKVPLIHAGTVAVYGTHARSTPVDDQTPVKPNTNYGRAKREAEIGLHALSRELDLPITVLRLPLLAGAHAPGNLERLAQMVVKGMPLPVGGARENRRSLLSVHDAADAFLAALNSIKNEYQAYCVADPEPLSTHDIVSAIAAGVDKNPSMVNVPTVAARAALWVMGKERLSDQLFGSLIVDGSRFKEATGWQPKHGLHAALWELGQSHLKEDLSNKL